MSDIASEIAAEHRWLATRCSCGHPIGQVKLGLADQVDHYIRHIATVTEAAVRARIAAELDRESLKTSWTAKAFALQHAVKIARGQS